MLVTHESMPVGTSGGWLANPELPERHAHALVDHLRTRLPNLVWHANPFSVAGLNAPVRQGPSGDTQAIDLRDGFDAVRGRWSRGHKAAPRQARRSGLEVAVASTEAEWRQYFSVYQDSLRRWGENTTQRYPWSLFDRLRAAPGVRLWVAHRDGDVVSGGICLYAPDVVTYWHASTLESAFALRPANLVVETMIADACERRSKWFDMGGSGRQSGVADFKRRFGATTLEIPRIVTTSLRARALARTWGRVSGVLRR
jgi:GNAT acetyltransferase-like protein